MNSLPLVEEKHRVQRLLSAASPDIADYFEQTQRAVEQLSRERDLKWRYATLTPPARPDFPTPAPAEPGAAARL